MNYITESKYFFIKTFGCQMNFYDSSLYEDYLLENGFKKAENIEDASILLVNTCAVREKSVSKVISFLGQVKKLNTNNNRLIVYLLGCMSPIYADILKRDGLIDIAIGPLNSNSIPYEFKRLISQIEGFSEKVKKIENKNFSRSITVIYGCNYFCSYCIVPYVRGKERSVPFDEVINRIKLYSENGAREITLLGQNVDHYGFDLPNSVNFSTLLNEVAKINKIEKIDFITSHPKDFNIEIINIMKESNKIYRHFHLPIQSGDDRILKLMNRNYSVYEYLKLIDKIRDSFPLASITTDIIVGFPSEDEPSFLNTIELVKKVKFDKIYLATYSKRPMTKASKIDSEVDPCEKKRRLNHLLSLEREISIDQSKRFIGTEEDVFLTTKLSKNKYLGKNLEEREVLLSSINELQTGDIVKVKVTECDRTRLIGNAI